MKKIEVHGISPDGSVFIMNHLTSDNAELDRNTLLNKATTMASDWGKVYPNDKFMVVEVPSGSRRSRVLA